MSVIFLYFDNVTAELKKTQKKQSWKNELTKLQLLYIHIERICGFSFDDITRATMRFCIKTILHYSRIAINICLSPASRAYMYAVPCIHLSFVTFRSSCIRVSRIRIHVVLASKGHRVCWFSHSYQGGHVIGVPKAICSTCSAIPSKQYFPSGVRYKRPH